MFMRLFRGRGDARGTWEGGAEREPVTREHFVRHLCSADERDWFGVYNVLYDNCSWGCVDIDVKNLPLARNVALALQRQGIPGWIEETTRGFHVWVFPDQPLVPATTMRQALTAACRAVDYVPKEVFPKQTKTSADGLGNYVRLPLNGVYATPRIAATRRFIDGTPIQLMDRCRAPRHALERVAAMLPRNPQVVDISVDMKAGLEYAAEARKIGGLVWRIWDRGPGVGYDRSDALCELAHRCREADVDAHTAYGLVVSADDRWGKFAGRGEDGLALIRTIISNTYGRIQSNADGTVKA